MRQFLIFSVFSLLLIVSCGDDNSVNSAKYGSLEGNVYDIETYELLSYVNITSVPPSASVKSNEVGYYFIKDLFEGNYKLTAVKEGYRTTMVNININSKKKTLADIFMRKLKEGEVDDPNDPESDPNDPDYGELDPNLILYIPIDNASIKDVTAHNHELEYPTLEFVEDRKGNQNSAVSFQNPQSYNNIRIAQNNMFNSTEFTVALWIYLPQYHGVSDAQSNVPLIGRWHDWGQNNSSNLLALFTEQSNLKIRNSLCDGMSISTYLSKSNLQKNEWIHIAQVYRNNRSQELYINGVLDTKITSPLFAQSSDYQYVIGKLHNGGGPQYLGAIDDVRIYNKALSLAEILALYNN